MLPSRRSQLAAINSSQAQHVGLWFDKYLKEQLRKGESVASGETPPHQKLVEQCAGISEPAHYEGFYNRWKKALTGVEAQTREAKVLGRLALGLGDESVIETAVTLHLTYGVPYIPGSALKGLTAAYARHYLGEKWREGGIPYQTVFGTTDEAGFITFFDALYVPGSGHKGQALYPDVITVHHQKYYQNEGVAPADWDSPIPVSFLSATGRYLVALAGPPAWVHATFDILGLALAEEGVGGKTSSGYGRMIFDGDGRAIEPTTSSKQASLPVYPPDVQQVLDGLAAMSIQQVAGSIHSFYQRWQTLEVEPSLKSIVAQAIVAKVRDAKREKQTVEKTWYQELLSHIHEFEGDGDD